MDVVTCQDCREAPATCNVWYFGEKIDLCSECADYRTSDIHNVPASRKPTCTHHVPGECQACW